MEKVNGSSLLKLLINEREKAAAIIKQERLQNYNGEIIFKVISQNNEYHYLYSLDNGKSFTTFTTTAANLILCHGYTGTYLGVYATSNGNKTKEYTDFDWVSYKGYPDY